jgi:nitrogen fixation NifU-like protein
MYSELISNNFANPTHNGVLDEPDAVLENVDPVCGDQVKVSLALDGEKISMARFRAWGCATSIAASNLFCRWLEGKTLDELAEVQPEMMSDLLGDLAPEQLHCVDMLVRMVGQVTKKTDAS